MRTRVLCLALIVMWFPALPLHAYRNPERFAAPVDDGGGAGKYFTLSRAEGYGCAVCHSQGTPVPLEIRNLPTAGYLPGQAYRITIDWPDDMPSVALNVEMTDDVGAQFGQLVAPDPATLTAADLCRQTDVSEPATAAQTTQIDAARRVLLIAECGQAQTSFDWIAPASPAHGYFSTSVVFSNRDGKLAGDRVVDIVQPFTLQPSNRYEGTCSVLDLRDHAAGSRNFLRVGACWMCGVFLGRRCLRRRYQRARQA